MRHVGTSLLASAGLITVLAGVVVQRSLGHLFTGFQLALTQPILLDDLVVVEGELGKVEEITLAYVVVHLWDQRRLVVPINYSGEAVRKLDVAAHPNFSGRHFSLRLSFARQRTQGGVFSTLKRILRGIAKKVAGDR